MTARRHIATETLEAMAEQGNELASLALYQRHDIARLRAVVDSCKFASSGDAEKAEATARNLQAEIARLKRRIAELESIK